MVARGDESEDEGSALLATEDPALLPSGRELVDEALATSRLRRLAPLALLGCALSGWAVLHGNGGQTRAAAGASSAGGRAGGRQLSPPGRLHAEPAVDASVTLVSAGASVLPQSEGDNNCSDALPGDKCYDAVTWAMEEGIWGHPEWYPGLSLWSRFEEFQGELSGQGKCPRPCRDPAAARQHKGIPGRALDLPGLWGTRRELQFYVYRAMGDVVGYPLTNVNVGDLAGTLWYLHNEIVPSVAVTRKYNITRIWRFKLTMKTTWEYFNVHRRQLGGFVAFDDGECTVPFCDKIWKHFGYIPGCQFQNMDPKDHNSAAYFSQSKTRVEGCHQDREPYCNNSIWYSLPGPCPGHNFESKDEECQREMPGGLCKKASGDGECTYSYETAGYIELDELAGIRDYKEFFDNGFREYSHATDAGTGSTFWNGRNDARLCQKRMEKVMSLFREKYPGLPACEELPPPPCDFDGWYTDSTGVKEFDWTPVHSPIVPTGLTKTHM